MKSLISKIWFPLAVVTLAAAGSVVSSPGVEFNSGISGIAVKEIVNAPDTVIYPTDGYKLRWNSDDFKMDASHIEDTLSDAGDSLSLSDSLAAPSDTLPRLTARDTIKAPDSLRLIDPFRYKYFVALLDSATHVFVRDSLIAAGDTLDWPRLDSLYKADSIVLAKIRFDEWYNGLSKEERKKYDMEELAKVKLAEINRKQARKDSIQNYKDSVMKATPRILETFALPDSMQYKRIVKYTHEQEFHKIDISPVDTGFNYRFYDYPFLRKDVNATWLGVAGSPVQYYNYFNRKSTDKVSFYEAQESWSYTPSTVPMYNTKTPYTELGYFGTLFAGVEKESDNLHLLTTQNITPEFNFTLAFDRFGGGGMLTNESTANKNSFITANYLGKRYMAHTGLISNKVSRGENGGLADISGIRDTTIKARELATRLDTKARSTIRKTTVFLDQQYRIPFTFINKLKARGAVADSTAIDPAALADTLVVMDDTDITTAFIGHSTEYSSYSRWYTDDMNNRSTSAFYNDVKYINPFSTQDSLRVSRLDNKAFIRLQPWAEDAIISKLNVGIGDRLLNYYTFDPTFTRKDQSTVWNSAYLYAGAEGSLREYIHWDAKGEYVFLGDEINDLSLDANLNFSFYPFRKARKSPLSLDLHFDTSLDEPEFYHQHMYTNHFKWDNDFGKISTTRLQGRISIPRWNLDAGVGYALLSNNVYYDTLGIIRQNTTPMSILSADLRKEFVLGILHLDNRVLFQMSSNQDVVPLPTLAFNLKYYIQFNISHGILLMQIGANGFYNTAWYSPAWNPALGVFHNQTDTKYNNGPYVDAFLNMQWKRATIFVKFENANQGWPMKKNDYFSADRYIATQRQIKLGIYWPFYTQPAKNVGAAAEAAAAGHSHEH